MSDIAISIQQVSKTFRQDPVLKDLSFEVSAGSSVGLIGKNGAGKTTLIKCMLDFIAFESGSIRIFDKTSSLVEARSRLAYLPEKFIPPYYLTGRDCLEYMLHLYQQSYEPDKVEQMLRILDLDISALDKSVREFSKGMSQKLGLAACMMSNRDLLILDEPMSGLDPKARAYLKHHLLKLKDQGKTLFFSTHMLADIQTLCDSVVILHNGNKQFAGSPKECCELYDTNDFEQAYLRCVEDEHGMISQA